MRNLNEILHGFVIPARSYVLVCGGRDYRDKDLVYAVLDKICPSFVVTGGQGEKAKNKGADLLAETWAKSNEYLPTHKVGLDVVHADWDLHGKAAGPLRNSEMLRKHPEIEWVIAFPGGRGTADMLSKAKRKSIPAVIFSEAGDYLVVRSFDAKD